MVDFSRLNKEYVSFWNIHDLQKAIESLTNGIKWMGGDFSLYPPDMQLFTDVLAPNYARELNRSISDVVNELTYETLVNWYADYVNLCIKEIEDDRKRIESQNSFSFFSNVLAGFKETGAAIETGLSSLFNDAILIGAGILVLYLIVNKS